MEESTSQAASLANNLAGQRIGSYRIIQPLGSGGMSTVYLAVHAETGHEVALKVLLGSFSRNSTLLQRFLREARSAANLEHPNVVAIYDRGVDQGRHYLALEYVPGGDYHDHVQRQGPLGVAEAIAVIRGVASGLRYAAGRRLIHRDVKPSNLLRTATGEPKIIDLGLALQSEFEDERVTREGTTVGTVDYMAPEQARDSRATSTRSDVYSLGCTFYYLLAGIPPYPGGDITDKLTRHARSPAPDIRDLRPDVPADLAAILLRMMAKEPNDRFGDYDGLIAALDAVRVGEGDEAPGIALVPLAADEAVDRPRAQAESRAGRPGVASPSDHGGGDTLPFESLGGLPLELADERDAGDPRPFEGREEVPLQRLGRVATPGESAAPAIDAAGESETSPAHRSHPAWILASTALGAVAILLAIGLYRILGGPGVPIVSGVEIPDPEADVASRPEVPRAVPTPGFGKPRREGFPGREKRTGAIAIAKTTGTPKESWDEPDDTEPVPGDPVPPPPGLEEFRPRLPEWARAPRTARSDEPLVVVRRVAEVTDGQTEPTLHFALDHHIGGSVELADDGPLPVDDLRMSGKSRVIRARRGYRPIVRIMRSRTEAAREQHAFLPLERKDLTLEGIDVIVDARDFSGRQTALFGCTGSNLTLRDCTITVANPSGAPFVLVRQESGPRPSRIRLERTLVRGGFVTVAELAGGECDLVLDGTAILGGIGPAVRVTRPDPAAEQRIFFVGSLLACPGPVVRCDQADARVRPRRLAIRAYGSAFGRLQGPGFAIASVISSFDPDAAAELRIDWAGDRNVFVGWKGFFARGADPTITVGSLAQVRSTWNATEQGSQELLAASPLSFDPSRVTPADLSPLLPAPRSLMTQAPRPVTGLFPKTFDGYPGPPIPDPISWISARPAAAAGIGPRTRKVLKYDPKTDGPAAATGGLTGTGGPGASRQADGDPPVLTMNTADPPWEGDLGAFLRERVPHEARHVRVRVEGSGVHRFTPVRLPDGITLEIRVDATPGAEPPSWSPDPQASGPALLELHGGALSLSGVSLRHDPSSRLDHLLALEHAHLVLYRCQVTVPSGSGGPADDLILFRAPTTRPMPDDPGRSPFQGAVDRPVCRLIETILISDRTAIRAELGRGLIALTRCAVAGEETALELDPGKVARRTFAADLWLDRCTLVSGRSIVRLGPWRGVLPGGPDRPWLVNSRHCAFLTLSDAKAREAALLRVDADAMAGGCLFWQADGDAYELDQVTAAGDAAAPPTRTRDLGNQWIQFWGSNRFGRIMGPRGPAFRLRERPRPGRIEPADLILDPTYHPQHAQLDVGADLQGLGIVRPGPRRN
jgi:serine/threonine-protein kinase